MEANSKLLEVELTARELEVMERVWNDETAAAIGDALYVSRRTVEWHIENVKGKLSDATGKLVTSRQAACKMLHKAGLIK